MYPEMLCLLTLLICFVVILLTTKYWGKNGLFVYTAIAVIASNIQVLKLTQYHFLEHPVALGTVLFSTIFAVDNILTEHYGTSVAQECVWISFFGYLFFAIVMKVADCHPSISTSSCTNMYMEIHNLFSPSFIILASSLLSYVCSQFVDIKIYSTIKKMTRGKFQAIRSFFSMTLSTFVDNCIFSFLAWILFATNPISLSELWETYIFITYIIRLIIAVLCVPLVVLVNRLIFVQNREDNV